MKAHEDPDSVARRAGDLDEGADLVVPIGPNGPQLEQLNYEPEFGPPHTADYCPCERGPCRHYLYVESHFEHGNAAGSLPDGYAPREYHRACMIQSGVYWELTGDSPVLFCNRWHPMLSHELALMEIAREEYYVQHPKHRDGFVPPTDDLDLDEDEDDEDDDLDLDEDDEKESPSEHQDTAQRDRDGDKPAT